MTGITRKKTLKKMRAISLRMLPIGPVKRYAPLSVPWITRIILTNHAQVGEAEEVPDNIEQGWDRFEDGTENKWDNAVDNVEDFPENAAEWTGEKVGAVESFGDDMGDAYDEGEDEGRGDDW